MKSLAPTALLRGILHPQIYTNSMEGRVIGDYRFLQSIGAGASSEVWECVNVRTNTIVAAKVIDLDCMLQDAFYRHFVNEITIHSRIRHPCITEVLDVAIDDEKFYMFLEYCDGGDLNDLVISALGLPEAQAKIYFAQIMSAISYIHRHQVAHRDIKLENIAITEEGYAKLTDFGLSKLQSDSPMYSRCGTLAYCAPEIIREQPYRLPVDIWSAGVLLYSMVACHLPWTTPDDSPERAGEETTRQILEGNILFPENFSPELTNLLCFMMAVNPDDRPTAEQVLGHVWLAGVPDITESVGSTETNPQLVDMVDAAIAEIGQYRERRLGHS